MSVLISSVLAQSAAVLLVLYIQHTVEASYCYYRTLVAYITHPVANPAIRPRIQQRLHCVHVTTLGCFHERRKAIL
jgi:hypothetical protein